MLLEIVFALAAGLVLGWIVGRALGQSRTRMETQRAEQLGASLEATKGELKTAREDLEKSVKEKSDLKDAHSQSDACQREEIARLKAEGASAEKNVEQAATALEEQRAENARVRNELLQSQTEVASLRARLEDEKSSAQEKLDLLKGARDQLSDHFKGLANDILETKSKSFTTQTETSLGALLSPLRDTIGAFQTRVGDLEKESITGRTELKTQIESLSKLNERLSTDAANLVTALKGSSRTQGDWGELVLESILEASGLRKGYEYRVQESFTREEPNEDGRIRARLDIIVDLPEGRHIILDSKVSLNDYNDYCAAQEDAAREVALARHLASVRNHIRELSRRDYLGLYQLNSLDFVVMFVPIEPAFMVALASDEKLWQEAWDKNVMLVSRTALLFVLRTVANLWRQEQQTRNVQEIVRRGGDLYDKLSAFASDLTEVGESLDEARSSYDEACKKLATGKGNAIRQAEMLKSLGIKPSKDMPPALLELTLEPEQLELAANEEK